MVQIKEISKNVSSLYVSSIVTYCLSFVSIVYLARILGPESYGYVEFAIVITSYFLIFANAGLPIIGIKQLVEQKGLQGSGFTDIICIRGLFGIISCLFLSFFVLFFSPYSPLQNCLILGYGIAIIPSVMNIDWIYKGIQKMHFIIINASLLAGLNLIFIIFFVKGEENLIYLPVFIIISNTISNFVAWSFLLNVCKKVNFSLSLSNWRSIIQKSFEYGSISFLGLIIYNSDILFLGFLKTSYEVGLYAAAYKVVYLIIGLSTPIHESLFPVMINYYYESHEKFVRIAQFIIKMSFFCFICIISSILFLNNNILTFIFGDKYIGANISLIFLTWASGIILLNTAFSRILFVVNKEKDCIRIVGFQCLVILTLNILLIPYYGVVGASISTLFGELISLFFYFKDVKGIIDISIINLNLRFSLGLLIVITTSSYLLIGTYVPFTLLILGIIFIFLLFKCGGLGKDEISLIKRSLIFFKDKD